MGCIGESSRTTVLRLSQFQHMSLEFLFESGGFCFPEFKRSAVPGGNTSVEGAVFVVFCIMFWDC